MVPVADMRKKSEKKQTFAIEDFHFSGKKQCRALHLNINDDGTNYELKRIRSINVNSNFFRF